MTRLMVGTALAVAAICAAYVVFLDRAEAQELRCANRDHLAAFLNLEHGLSLHSWGLDDAGDMVELFLSDRGHWAVVKTKPNSCATVEMPHKERGRLWLPPKQNDALPGAKRMNEGNPL